MNKLNKLWYLFITIFGISATTNGGYAIVSVMKSKFVEKYHWFDEKEMLDLVAIGQSCPGPIAINTSILVGHRIAGYLGSFVACLAVVLPPLTIMTIVTIFYNIVSDSSIVKYLMKGMQAGVVAILVDVTISLFINITKEKSIISYLVIVGVFLIRFYTNISTLWISIVCVVIGIVRMLIVGGKDEH